MIVVDTSVLINFLRIDGTDLFNHLERDFAVTSHVFDEVASYFPDLTPCLEEVIELGTLHELTVSDPTELSLFGDLLLSRRLSSGECSAMAVAIHRGHELALDRTRAHQEVLDQNPSLMVLKTQDIMVSLLKEGLLNIAECDHIKTIWETRFGFRLPISSFAEFPS